MTCCKNKSKRDKKLRRFRRKKRQEKISKTLCLRLSASLYSKTKMHFPKNIPDRKILDILLIGFLERSGINIKSEHYSISKWDWLNSMSSVEKTRKRILKLKKKNE